MSRRHGRDTESHDISVEDVDRIFGAEKVRWCEVSFDEGDSVDV